MKQFIFRTLVLGIVIMISYSSIAQTVTTVNGIRYLIEDKNAIVGRQDKELDGDIVIPESIEYEGKLYSVTGMVMPTNVTAWSSNTVTVEGGAFQDCGIKSIVLPNTIKAISAGAFNNCRELVNVILPNSAESLGAASFAGCSKLSKLDIPETVKDFGSGSSYGFVSYVFGGCTSLKDINIPSAVKTLAAGCFMNCGLDSLYIPETITSIGENSLYIPELKSLTMGIKDIRNISYSKNTFADISNTSLYVPKGSLRVYQEYEPWASFMVIKEYGEDGEIIVPDQTTVTINNIRYILKDGFATIGRQKTSLDGDIVIPETLEYEGYNYPVTDIIDCKDLTCYSEGSISCVDGAFQNTNIKSIVLPNSITIIPAGTFQGCYSLEAITLPNSLVQLGAASLAGCSKLKEVSLPETVKDLASNTVYGYRSYTFGGCTELKNITIPSGVTRLASGCFYNSGIESIVIPENLSILDEQCLKTNTIKTLKICVKDMDKLTYTDDCFGDLSDCNLIVPKGSKQVYQEYYPWITCKSITEYDDGSEPFIPTKLTVRIDGVRYILDNGKATIGRQNKDLTGTIVIPSEVSYEGNTYTVSDMIKPTDIIAWSSNSVTCTNGAFQECQVDTVILPNSLITISAGAFNSCYSLKHIQLPENTVQLGTACFAGCSNLEEVFLPESITSFGSYTAYGFKSYIFGGCSKLKKVNMPTAVETLAEGCFKESGLEIFLISSNITNLQEDCFDANNLKAIKITHKNLNQLNYTESCFANVSNVDLYVPEGCANLYKEFYPWKNFKSITEYVDKDDEFQYNAYKVSFVVEDENNVTRAKSRSLASYNNPLFNEDYFASGTAIKDIPVPQKDGYIFVGWENMPDIMPANDLVVKAIFEIDQAAVLATAKDNAKQELAVYRDKNDYRESQQIELANAITAGNEAIDAATSVEEVNSALSIAKAAIDKIKTKSQIAEDETAAEVNNFKDSFASILSKNVDTVTAADKETIDAALTAYSQLSANVQAALKAEKELLDALKQKIDNANSLATAKDNAKSELANYKDKNNYLESQQAELANAIAAGYDAIDAATSVDEVNSALSNAKAVIDKIKTKSQIAAAEEEEETAAEVNNFKDSYASILSKTVETVTAADKESIDAALTAYSQLSASAQVALKAEKDLLDALKQKVDNIINIDTRETVTFEDTKFEKYMLEHFDSDKDGSLTPEEALKIDVIACTDLGISSLKGIEYCENLTELYFGRNNITSLDLSKNPKLTILDFDHNKVTQLDLSNNSQLIGLDCESNKLRTLDIRSCPLLSEFGCQDNPLEELYVKTSQTFAIFDVPSSTHIVYQISFADAKFEKYMLEHFDSDNDGVLTSDEALSVDVIACTDLGISSLKGIEYCENLTELYFGRNNVTSIDLSKNTNLTILDFDHNKVTQLDLSNNNQLIGLDCESNMIKTLDVSSCTLLTEIGCLDNPLDILYILSTQTFSIFVVPESTTVIYKDTGETGISEVLYNNASITSIVGLDGALRTQMTKGLNIVKDNDGKTKKVLIR